MLLIVGALRPDIIGRHKNLSAYSFADYNALLQFIGTRPLVLCPFVLTELSNSIVQGVEEPLRSQIRLAIRFVIDCNDELQVPSSAAAARPEFEWLGLTDAALIDLGDQQTAILTADGPLAVAAAKAGKSVVHFEEVRWVR